ncbi:hypothetical protein EDI_252610 [Entamoeba dispar SAW760]|uniref:Uncharacterized protein n=1 Tax=Entamoeba dispar (strain ATCC PRA-260 / SAW760) TaxID=370354 RepID=B0EF66_ENTDS|nr:uncharacterized protein EDI_252610 [Entamoeba dispar SAW760]EDR26796.1 hypothetical protein EDI_252610 [Entamoeba dispar SAW760]|eukprot:EDR26796.1 hypothetical protein EDI_252610 [Entamoeba dispar SAW760]
MKVINQMNTIHFRRETHKKTSEYKCCYSFKENRDYQSEQESLFLALLSQEFTIKLICPNKRCVVTLPFLRILEIQRGLDDCVAVNDWVNNRINERLKEELSQGVSRKTAQRRSENYKITETLHLIMDLLSEFGYFFQTRTTTGKKGICKIDIAYKVYNKNKLMFDQESISRIGSSINKKIISLPSENGIITIKKGSLDLLQIISL